jgi:hypothetical protein
MRLLAVGTVRMSIQQRRRESGPNEGLQGLKPLANISVYMDAVIEHAKDNK